MSTLKFSFNNPIKKRGKSMAASKKKATKKKVSKKKVTKKKVAKKKVAKKKVTKKKVAKKKVAKKKVTKKKTTKRRKTAAQKRASEFKKLTGKSYAGAAKSGQSAHKKSVAAKKRKAKASALKRKKVVAAKKRKSKASTKKRKLLGKVRSSKKVVKHPTNRKQRKGITNKMKKGQVVMTGWKASGRKKSKTKGRKFEKVLMTKRTNPIGGTMLNKVNKMTKSYINHEVSEIGGLFSGGVLHGAANDLITRYVPANILAKFEGALGPFAGSAAPILVGALLSKFGGKNNVVKSVSKGMIGAGIVGLGASAYQIVKPAESTMSGYPLLSDEVDSEIGAIETDDFGNMDEDYGEVETSDFGAIETDDFGYMDEYYEEY